MRPTIYIPSRLTKLLSRLALSLEDVLPPPGPVGGRPPSSEDRSRVWRPDPEGWRGHSCRSTGSHSMEPKQQGRCCRERTPKLARRFRRTRARSMNDIFVTSDVTRAGGCSS
jgi:hypothetical protein